jgi:hypothetical protein
MSEQFPQISGQLPLEERRAAAKIECTRSATSFFC